MSASRPERSLVPVTLDDLVEVALRRDPATVHPLAPAVERDLRLRELARRHAGEPGFALDVPTPSLEVVECARRLTPVLVAIALRTHHRSRAAAPSAGHPPGHARPPGPRFGGANALDALFARSPRRRPWLRRVLDRFDCATPDLALAAVALLAAFGARDLADVPATELAARRVLMGWVAPLLRTDPIGLAEWRAEVTRRAQQHADWIMTDDRRLMRALRAVVEGERAWDDLWRLTRARPADYARVALAALLAPAPADTVH